MPVARRVHVCEFVCILYVCMRDCARACECVREHAHENDGVRGERERKPVCVYGYERKPVCVFVCVCMCNRMCMEMGVCIGEREMGSVC